MININYKTTDGDKSVEIPISWRDISWSKFVQLTSKDFDNELKRLAFLTGIELNVLLNNPMFLAALIESCQFIWTDDIEAYSSAIKAEYKVEVAQQDWGKIEAAKALLQANANNMWGAGSGIVKVYLDKDIGDMPASEAIGIVSFFLRKLQSLESVSKS